MINDGLAAIVAIETTLGAGVNGVFGSLAARLNQAFPGSGGQPGVIPFTNAQTVSVPGSQHNVGQAALLWQLWDAQVPAHAMQAGSVTLQVSPATYDVTLAFATPTTGSIAIGAQAPLYIASFTNTTTVSVPGTTHQIATPDLIFQAYNNANPIAALEPGSLTVDQTSRNVVMTFTTPQSGTLVLSGGGPYYAVNFTNQTTLSIPGSTHMLGTAALLFQAYDNATPRAALGDPDVSVHPVTFDVTVTFGVSLSGRFVLAAAATTTGKEFAIRDAGVIDQTAVSVQSSTGSLELQAGAGNRIVLNDRLGNPKVTLDTANGYLGVGVTTPAHQLELSTGDAVKAGGGVWLAPSDIRLKADLEPFTEGLDVLLACEPIRYTYNGLGGLARTGEAFVGLEAQAMLALAPALVKRYRGRLEADGPLQELLALDGSPLLYMLINAVKTLHADLLDARRTTQRLEHQLALVAGRLAALEPPNAEEPS